jgi:hypothetical protein
VGAQQLCQFVCGRAGSWPKSCIVRVGMCSLQLLLHWCMYWLLGRFVRVNRGNSRADEWCHREPSIVFLCQRLSFSWLTIALSHSACGCTSTDARADESALDLPSHALVCPRARPRWGARPVFVPTVCGVVLVIFTRGSFWHHDPHGSCLQGCIALALSVLICRRLALLHCGGPPCRW